MAGQTVLSLVITIDACLILAIKVVHASFVGNRRTEVCWKTTPDDAQKIQQISGWCANFVMPNS
jgi:hypothetical protein